MKIILPAGAALMALLLLGVVLLLLNDYPANRFAGQPPLKKQGTNGSSLQQRTESAGAEQTAGSQDPALAKQDVGLEAALAEQDPARRNELLDQWAKSVELSAMAATLARMESIPDSILKFQARAVLLTSWLGRDLEGALTWFGDRGSADGLHQQARDLLGQALAQREPGAMLSWMEESLPEASRQELYGLVFRQWAAKDPQGTADLLQQQMANPPPGGRPGTANALWVDLTGQVAAQWSNMDVKHAVSWAQSLPDGLAKTLALSQMSYKWTESDPQAAAAYAAGQNDPQFVWNVAAKWAESDPQAAGAWVRRLPEGEVRDKAAASMAAIWSTIDPVAAANYAANLPAGNTQNQAMIAVVSAWAYTAPAQVAQWVTQFPEGSVREQAMQQLAGAWAGSDADKAAQWLQGLPQTKSRDCAVDAFSGAVSASSPGTAFQWAQTISNETLRNQQLQNVVRIWLAQDPAGAQQAIAQSDLPQDIKSRLLPKADR